MGVLKMRSHSTATLMGLTKKELVEYVRMAEHNQEVAEEALNQQAENVKDWHPIRHGEWIVCGDGEYVPFMCSACGKTTSWYHKQTANYCPNCGAKMDGDGNE